MTTENPFTVNSLFSPTLAIRMFVGWAIGLAVICFFVFGVDYPDPTWPDNWRVRPLILTPILTAIGGAGVHVMTLFGSAGGWRKFVSIVLSVLGFIFSVWMGIVLGLVGTMWN